MKRLLIPALAFVAAAAHAQSQRPNIIFVFSDDHASHAISAYGSRINRTPHIDQLASEGMLFENCFVTNSICAPSRAVILTGKHSHINGHIDNGRQFDNTQQTFPKLLRQAGYQTALIGKWHLQSEPTGFDYWEHLIGQGPYYNPVFRSAKGDTPHTGYTTTIITEKAVNWLAEHGKEKPFMLMVQHKAPHRNWEPEPKYMDLFEGQTIPEPPDLFDDWSTYTSSAAENEMSIASHFNRRYDLKIGEAPDRLNAEQRAIWEQHYSPRNEAFDRMNLSGRDLTRYYYQRYIKDYLRVVQSVDDSVGAIMDYLKLSGMDRNTIVIYSSDQGFYLGDYGWYDKRWMYEPSLRTPLIVKWPGVTEPGSRSDALAQNLDFAETFLDMAGVGIPDDMQGLSLRPILEGDDNPDWRSAIYYHYYEYPQPHRVAPHRGVRTDRFKLMEFYTKQEWEMYDLQTDPREKNNLWNKPGYEQIQTDMVRLLAAMRRKYQDTGD